VWGVVMHFRLCLLAYAAVLCAFDWRTQAENLRKINSDSSQVADLKFFIMVDAGSSGTRLHVHPYLDHEPMPIIYPSRNLKITPGLSSYELDPPSAAQSLTKLLEFAKLNIPEALWTQTPIHLKATAGLRSIPIPAAERILDECRRMIAKYPFKCDPAWAGVISGTVEGVYGWISANYLEGVFDKPDTDTVGVIEMGGASLQITYVPKNSPDSLKDVCIPVTVGSRTYSVYTHSYLHYGLEAAQRLFSSKHQKVIDEQGHPCELKGTSKGAGSHERCATLMDSLFDKSNCSHASRSCSFNGVVQPRITHERFYAIENFHYTSDFFGLTAHSDPYTEMERLGKEYCSARLDEIVKAHPKEPRDTLSKYCFSSIYLPKVVKHGFGITQPHLTARIRRDVGGIKIDWALGAVLHEMLALKSDSANNGGAQRSSPGSASPSSSSAAAAALTGDTPPSSTSASAAFASGSAQSLPEPLPEPEVEILHHPYLHNDAYPAIDSPGLPNGHSSSSSLLLCLVVVFAVIGFSVTIRNKVKASFSTLSPFRTMRGKRSGEDDLCGVGGSDWKSPI